MYELVMISIFVNRLYNCCMFRRYQTFQRIEIYKSAQANLQTLRRKPYTETLTLELLGDGRTDAAKISMLCLFRVQERKRLLHSYVSGNEILNK